MLGRGAPVHRRHTRPQAKEILGVASFDGVHGAVFDAHNGARSVQRHGWVEGRGCCGENRGQLRSGAVVVVVVEQDVRFRQGDCVKHVGCGLDGRAPGCYRATTHIE